jgi:putative pyruvate formate lyase activating enzyme
MGEEISLDSLTEMFLSLQSQGCHNINLVSPTPYVPHIAMAIVEARKKGLVIPVVYNTNAYESVEALKVMDGLVDVYLPDFKYWNDAVAAKLSGTPKEKSYAVFAKEAILEMKRQVGDLVVEDKIAKKGLLIRHLVLPGGLAGSQEIFHWIEVNLGVETHISLMSQYYPAHKAFTVPLLRRNIRQEEYDTVVDYLMEKGFKMFSSRDSKVRRFLCLILRNKNLLKIMREAAMTNDQIAIISKLTQICHLSSLPGCPEQTLTKRGSLVFCLKQKFRSRVGANGAAGVE